MNYRMLLYMMGKILRVEGLLMLLPFLCAVINKENNSMWSFAATILILLIIGTALTIKRPPNMSMRAKDGFVTVGIAWILLSLFGALPFYFSGQIHGYVNCLFETVSGFSTTGASIVSDIEALDKSMLFWRSFTHWVGGMGVLVFILAILPQSDIKSSGMMHVMRAEVPGPTVGKLVSKLRRTARIMYEIYIVMTIIQFVLLMLGGMPLFDSIVNSFATAGTGGFAIKNASIAAYNSAYLDGVITVFMILFGVNFNVFYLIITGHFIRAIKSEELWWYLGIIAASIAAITINISSMYDNAFESFRYSSFAVASIISTTGFATADFNTWPTFSKVILVLLMFIGASAGSTGGGLKIARLIILIKNGLREIKYIFQPNAVISVKFEGKPVERETIRGTTSYLIIYIMFFCVSLLLLCAMENIDMVSSFTAVAACYNNIGPGLEIVGPLGNYSGFCDGSKILLSFSMLAGRLELFPILMLMSAASWKNN